MVQDQLFILSSFSLNLFSFHFIEEICKRQNLHFSAFEKTFKNVCAVLLETTAFFSHKDCLVIIKYYSNY